MEGRIHGVGVAPTTANRDEARAEVRRRGRARVPTSGAGAGLCLLLPPHTWRQDRLV
eukprot:COSAG01_NODE_75543_length_195_cov_23.114583_1_plen_56_part_01